MVPRRTNIGIGPTPKSRLDLVRFEPVILISAPSPARWWPRVRLSRAAHRPDGSLEMQFTGFGLLHHAVEIPSRRRSEVLGVLGRNNRQRDRGQIPAHRQAGIAP